MIVNESKHSNLQTGSELPTNNNDLLCKKRNELDDQERDLAILRAKNAIKTIQITNLQEIHRDNKSELLKLATQIQSIKAENVVDQCLAAAQIRYLGKDLDKVLDENAILKFEKSGGRLSRLTISATSDDDDGSMEFVNLSPVIKSMKTVRTLKGLTSTIDYETTAKRRKLLTASSIPSRFGQLTPTSVTSDVGSSFDTTTHKVVDQPEHMYNTHVAVRTTSKSTDDTSSIVNLNVEKNEQQRQRGRPRKVLKTEVDHTTEIKDDASSTTSRKSAAERSALKTHCETVLSGTASLKEQIKSLEAIAMQYAYRSRKVSTNAALIEEGVVEKLVTTLNNKTIDGTLLHKSLLVLNNLIAHSTDCQFASVMTHTTLIPRLVKLVNTPSKEVQEQAIWVLDNIVQDFGPCRQQVIDAGLIDEIDKVIIGDGELNESVAKVTARLLDHIMAGNNAPLHKQARSTSMIMCVNYSQN